MRGKEKNKNVEGKNDVVQWRKRGGFTLFIYIYQTC